ncbi:MAG: helix-turn-helix domain-containing protein, partial [Cyclobacteriaceae bacterium]
GHQSGKFAVPLTRQQIADMVGMRVETVIRTVKKLEDSGKVRLVNHKILV